MSAWLVLKTYAYNSNPSTYCKLKYRTTGLLCIDNVIE